MARTQYTSAARASYDRAIFSRSVPEGTYRRRCSMRRSPYRRSRAICTRIDALARTTRIAPSAIDRARALLEITAGKNPRGRGEERSDVRYGVGRREQEISDGNGLAVQDG